MPQPIFLIYEAWIDPLENRNAHGYKPCGYRLTEEAAKHICNNGGHFTEEDCWSIAHVKGKKLPKYKYEMIQFCSLV